MTTATRRIPTLDIPIELEPTVDHEFAESVSFGRGLTFGLVVAIAFWTMVGLVVFAVLV